MELSVIPTLDLSLGRKLGEGAFGVVRLGRLPRLNRSVAVKLESSQTMRPLLPNEATIMLALRTCPGVPELYESGTWEDYHYLVMQLLGKSLSHCFHSSGNRLSIRTVFKCADQILTTFEGLQKSNIVHRDVKPENFLIENDSGRVFTIDFGLARKLNPALSFRIHTNDTGSVVGTLPFVSLNLHLGLPSSFRDDLESLVYMFIYLLKGSLPWYGPGIPEANEKQIRVSKQETSTTSLCQNLPNEFEQLLRHAKSLTMDLNVNYSAIRNVLKAAAKRLDVDVEGKIDWDEERKAKYRAKSHDSVNLKGRKLSTDSELPSYTSSMTIKRSKSKNSVSKKQRNQERKRTLLKTFQGFIDHKPQIFEKRATLPEKIEPETPKTPAPDSNCCSF